MYVCVCMCVFFLSFNLEQWDQWINLMQWMFHRWLDSHKRLLFNVSCLLSSISSLFPEFPFVKVSRWGRLSVGLLCVLFCSSFGLSRMKNDYGFGSAKDCDSTDSFLGLFREKADWAPSSSQRIDRYYFFFVSKTHFKSVQVEINTT